MTDIDVNAMLKDYIKNLCKDNDVKDNNAIQAIGGLDIERLGHEKDLLSWNSEDFKKEKENAKSEVYSLQQEFAEKQADLGLTEKTLKNKQEKLDYINYLNKSREDKKYISKTMEEYRKMRPEIKRMYRFFLNLQHMMSEKGYQEGCGGCGGCS